MFSNALLSALLLVSLTLVAFGFPSRNQQQRDGKNPDQHPSGMAGPGQRRPSFGMGFDNGGAGGYGGFGSDRFPPPPPFRPSSASSPSANRQIRFDGNAVDANVNEFYAMMIAPDGTCEYSVGFY